MYSAPSVLVNDLKAFLEHVPLQQRQHAWFMHEGHHFNFFKILDSQSTGLHDYLTLIFWDSHFDEAKKFCELSVYQQITSIRATSRECQSGCQGVLVKQGFSIDWDDEHELALKCTIITMSILYKEQKNIADISASTGFWTYS
jgi:hypothetical protein